MLGNWEAAYKDFCKAQLSDFDEDVQTWCKEVEVNVNHSFFFFSQSMIFSFVQAKKVTEHKRKYERLRETKEAENKRERIRKAQEAYAKAQKEENERRAQEQQSRFAGGQGFPGDSIELLIISDVLQTFLFRWNGRNGRNGWWS